jgi:hypothetical protein
MDVRWRTEEPPVKENGISEQLVVKTNYGNLNTAMWSANNGCWYFDGLTASKEMVVSWLSGLEIE